MMADQPPPLEATPILNEVPLLPHMVNGDSIQQASKSRAFSCKSCNTVTAVVVGGLTFKYTVENRTNEKLLHSIYDGGNRLEIKDL